MYPKTPRMRIPITKNIPPTKADPLNPQLTAGGFGVGAQECA
jgi:hypothetical protein